MQAFPMELEITRVIHPLSTLYKNYAKSI